MDVTEVSTPPRSDDAIKVAVLTLGCARNEVDSEELAGRLAAEGFQLVVEPAEADTVVVNTCGFVESAKKDSVDTLLAAADLKDADGPQSVVAVGCLAERYGAELAEALPEADAVLGFDDYPRIAERLRAIVGGERPASHVPRDRRTLLPLTPVERDPATISVPGVSPAPDAPRRRLGTGPMAPLKLASGCDRRCTFCAIPRFRGSFVSRRPTDVLAEARWLAETGVRELFLVSENTTSYGKDLGDLRLLEGLLDPLAAIDGIDWVRVSYLQPAEMRDSLLDAMAQTPGVVPYFDLSFQHAAPALLRRMRRFGDPDSFLQLIERVRAAVPSAGIRSNVIVGFPGESEADVEVLTEFLQAARLDVVGVFGYSDEDGTEAATYDDKIPAEEVAARVGRVNDLVEQLTSDRAAERIGEEVRVLIESRGDEGAWEGRSEHQGPEVDGITTLAITPECETVRVGDIVTATVVASEGVDLHAQILAGEAGR